MDIQTFTIGERQFAVVPEREFQRLQKRAAESEAQTH